MIAIFCGDRYWHDEAPIRAKLEELKKEGLRLVIEGEARGADRLAREEALKLAIPVLAVPAEWGRLGRAAGAVRNAEMLNWLLELRDLEEVLVVAFHKDITSSKGTKNMVQRATRELVRVHLYDGSTWQVLENKYQELLK